MVMRQVLWLLIVAVICSTQTLGDEDIKNGTTGRQHYDWISSGHKYLTYQDWYVAPYKWQILRANSMRIGDFISQRNRSVIWEHFRSLHDNNFKTKATTFIAAEIKKFTKGYDDLKNLDKSVENLLDKEWVGKDIVYDNQIILFMEENDIVHDAVLSLYRKHPEMSTIAKWNPDSKKFKIVAGSDEKLGARSRVQVVGHGRFENGKMFLSGMSGVELAAAIDTLPVKKEEKLGRISLVGCNVASQPTAKEGFLSNTFLEDFLKTLRSQFSIETTVSARTTLVRVRQDGRKETAKITPNGIEWKNKDPQTKVIASLDNNNHMMMSELSATEHETVYPCRNCKSLGDKFSPAKTVSQIGDLYVVVYKDGAAKRVLSLTAEDMSTYLKSNTKETFTNDPNVLIVNTLKARGVSNIPALGEIRLKSFIGHNAEVLLSKKKSLRVNIGADVQDINVLFYTHNKPTEETVPVREIKNYKQLVEDINWLGLNGPKKSGIEYYRYGDWVISLNLNDFYVGERIGVISNSKALTPNQEEVRVGLGHGGESYHSMRQNLKKKYDLYAAKEWIRGNNKYISGRDPKLQEGCLTLAVFISEACRNFKTHIINMMAIQLNTDNKLSGREFLDNHPMARGGTWPEREKTGFEHDKGIENTDAILEVKAKELSFVRSWLNGKVENKKMGGAHVDYKCVSSMDVATGVNTYDPKRRKNIISKLYGFVKGVDEEEIHNEPLEGALGDHLGEDIKMRSNNVEARAKPLLMSQAIKEDHIYLSRMISKTLEEQIGKESLKKVHMLEDSVELKGDELKLKVVKSDDALPTEISCKIDDGEFKSKEMIKNINDEVSGMSKAGKPSKIAEISKRLNLRLTMFGVFGSIGELEEGKTAVGAVNLAQNLYGLSEMSGLDKRIFRMAGKGLAKVLTKTITAVSTAAAVEMASKVAAGVGSVFGIGFGIYSAVEDFERGTVLGDIDGALDVGMTMVDMLGPEAEPVALALLFIRLGIDDFYNEIKEQLGKLSTDASFGDILVATFKGIGFALRDVFEQFTIEGQIMGAIVNSNKIKEAHSKSEKFVHTLSDASNYFKIEEETGDRKKINFLDGRTSLYGGSITFRLLDDGHATMTLADVPDDEGNVIEKTKTIALDSDVNDIVLGIGESISLSWKTEKAKFLFFITVCSREVISAQKSLTSTLHGTYYGNSNNNTFFAVQKLDDSIASRLSFSLSAYFYKLFGEDGNDTFYLGPQKSHVEGGEGHDTYIIPSYGGHTEINNYARDGAVDRLFFNISCSRIWVSRVNMNLVLGQTTNHLIVIQNWFVNSSYQHLEFRAKDGVFFEVVSTVLHQPTKRIVAIDRSYALEKDNHVVDTSSKPIYAHVRVIIGSKFSDTLIGNSLPNSLDGRMGKNLLKGGLGADKYIIYDSGDCDKVDNYATDGVNDLVSLNILFNKIEVKRIENNSLRLSDNKTCVTILNWFVNASYQHLTGKSSDGVIFNIHINNISQVVLTAILIDCETLKTSQMINLTAHVRYKTVAGVIGSPFNDVIIGNNKNNYLTGKQGNDIIQGGLGSDFYVIGVGGGNDIIRNKALDEKKDLLLFGCSYDNISIAKDVRDLVIDACSEPNTNNVSGCGNNPVFSVRLQSWFENELYQHLSVKSIDGVTFELPTREEEAIIKLPILLDRSKRKTSVTVNAKLDRWKTVQGIIGSDITSSKIIGNQLDNVLQVRGSSSYLEGGNGSDIYRVFCGNVSIQNFAHDNKTDMLQLNTNFMNLSVEQNGNDLVLVRAAQNLSHYNQTVVIKDYKNGTYYQHLIGKTKDGIAFYFAKRTHRLQAFLIDKQLESDRVVIDLGESYTWVNVRKAVGAMKGPNCIKGNMNRLNLVGGNHPDLIEGHDKNDIIEGKDGEDLIDGHFGDDVLIGGPGPDWMLGSLGDDFLYPGEGADRVDGGYGLDTVLFQGDSYHQTGVLVDLYYGQGYGADATNDIYMNIENIIGTEFDDILIGTDKDNVLKGRGGSDFLYPHKGHDILVGGNGMDVYIVDGNYGLKEIYNFAQDNVTDILYCEDRNYESLKLYRENDNLIIHIGDIYGRYWCPVDDIGFNISNWFKDNNYQHLTIYLNDMQLELEEFHNLTVVTPYAHHCSVWNKFVCSILSFGVGNLIAIMVGGFLIPVIFVHSWRYLCSTNVIL